MAGLRSRPVRQLRCWSSDASLDRNRGFRSEFVPIVSGTSLVLLALLSGLAARAGGARVTVRNGIIDVG
jgi:hypothetical protein